MPLKRHDGKCGKIAMFAKRKGLWYNGTGRRLDRGRTSDQTGYQKLLVRAADSGGPVLFVACPVRRVLPIRTDNRLPVSGLRYDKGADLSAAGGVWAEFCAESVRRSVDIMGFLLSV